MPAHRRLGRCRNRSRKGPAVSDASSARPSEATAVTIASDDSGSDDLSYHPDDPCCGESGFWGSLSTAQQDELSKLRQSFQASEIDPALLLGDGRRCPAENLDLCLLRFLRASSWSADKAQEVLQVNADWRKELDMPRLLQQTPTEVLGESEETINALFESLYPNWHLGYDRRGRPVLLHRYSHFDTAALKQVLPLEKLVLFHCWEQEMNAELLRARSAELGCTVETYCLILDFEGMGMRHFTRDFIWLLQSLGAIDRAYYPGHGGDSFLVNVPPVFHLVWSSIRGFVGGQAKVHVYGRGDDWRGALQQYIAAEELPPEYGGSGSRLHQIPYLGHVHGAAIARSTLPSTELASTEVRPSVQERGSLPDGDGDSSSGSGNSSDTDSNSGGSSSSSGDSSGSSEAGQGVVQEQSSRSLASRALGVASQVTKAVVGLEFGEVVEEAASSALATASWALGAGLSVLLSGAGGKEAPGGVTMGIIPDWMYVLRDATD